MPLSKERNRERMRAVRLHASEIPPFRKVVQPKPIERVEAIQVDADGNRIYDDQGLTSR